MFMTNCTAIHAGGKVVGNVQDGVFHKQVQSSRHMLRSPRAWALDSRSLLDAERAGAIVVEIHDTETTLTYIAAIAQLRAQGVRLDRGFGEQIALPLHLWRVEQPGARQLTLI